jgi:hypothetical protein
MSKPDFYQLGYNAINATPPNLTAFKEALTDARASQDSYDIDDLYRGAFMAATSRKGDDEQTTRLVVYTITSFAEGIDPDTAGDCMFYALQVALYGNFIFASLLIERIPDNDTDLISKCLIYTAKAAAEADLVSEFPPTKEYQSMCVALIHKLNKSNQKPIKWKKQRLRIAVDEVISGIKFRESMGSKKIETLETVLYILVQYVILPGPPTGGDDFYKRARELWEKYRFEKVKALKQGTPSGFDDNIIKNIKTFGLQRFCTKCHGEVL